MPGGTPESFPVCPQPCRLYGSCNGHDREAYNKALQRYEPVVQQMKQLTLLAFNILHSRLPRATSYAEYQRAAQEYSSLFVTYTSSLCGFQPQRELVLRTNAGLTPCLKPRGCASALLNMRDEFLTRRPSACSLRSAYPLAHQEREARMAISTQTTYEVDIEDVEYL